MEIIEINEENKNIYNKIVTHPLQSYEWGEFRIKTGVKVIRRGITNKGKLVEGFTLTIHKIPKLKYNIGYLPKGNFPSKDLIKTLIKIGEEENCIFIQLEPNTIKASQISILKSQFIKPSFHPLFTKYSFILDLTKSEEDLLKSFHSKTRYNIKVAQKHKVKVEINNSEKAFEEYLVLTDETTNRQKFYAHTPEYHKKMWDTLKIKDSNIENLDKNKLSAVLLTASLNKKILTTWVLFVFQDTLYYPYGASSSENRNVMASNLIMWEAIKLGKKLGLKKFDMWGALGPDPDKNDPWYGFHRFKEGYGAIHTEFLGSYDLIINLVAYQLYKVADKTRWLYLRLSKFV